MSRPSCPTCSQTKLLDHRQLAVMQCWHCQHRCTNPVVSTCSRRCKHTAYRSEGAAQASILPREYMHTVQVASLLSKTCWCCAGSLNVQGFRGPTMSHAAAESCAATTPVRAAWLPPNCFGRHCQRQDVTHRTWNIQPFGNFAASASAATATCTTSVSALCRAAMCAWPMADTSCSGCRRACQSTSSATQLPTPAQKPCMQQQQQASIAKVGRRAQCVLTAACMHKWCTSTKCSAGHDGVVPLCNAKLAASDMGRCGLGMGDKKWHGHLSAKQALHCCTRPHLVQQQRLQASSTLGPCCQHVLPAHSSRCSTVSLHMRPQLAETTWLAHKQ